MTQAKNKQTNKNVLSHCWKVEKSVESSWHPDFLTSQHRRQTSTSKSKKIKSKPEPSTGGKQFNENSTSHAWAIYRRQRRDIHSFIHIHSTCICNQKHIYLLKFALIFFLFSLLSAFLCQKLKNELFLSLFVKQYICSRRSFKKSEECDSLSLLFTKRARRAFLKSAN